MVTNLGRGRIFKRFLKFMMSSSISWSRDIWCGNSVVIPALWTLMIKIEEIILTDLPPWELLVKWLGINVQNLKADLQHTIWQYDLLFSICARTMKKWARGSRIQFYSQALTFWTRMRVRSAGLLVKWLEINVQSLMNIVFYKNW